MENKNYLEFIWPLRVAIIVTAFILSIGSFIKIKYLDKDLKNLQEKIESTVSSDGNITYVPRCNEEAYTLLNCPICHSKVELYPVRDSVYIECQGCKLCTDYFDSTEELVNYWNNR